MATNALVTAHDLLVDRVTSWTGFRAMREEWDRLWRSIPARTPFQSSAWLLSWWEAFGDGGLQVFAFRDHGQLVGLAPLYRTVSEAGIELRLMGAGVSDYLDILAAPGMEAAISAATRRVLNDDAEWAMCWLDHLRPGSPLLTMTAPADATDVCAEDVPCPVLALRAPHDLDRALSTRIAKQLRYYRRRAERIGPVRVEFATDATVGSMLADLCSLHAARWAAKGATGVLSTEAVRAFHRAAAPALLKSGLLRMHALSVAGRTAAIYYGLHAGDRAFYYIGGFDPEFAAISPGTLAVASAIQAAVDEGATAYDFLGGREAYKYAWNAIEHPRVNRCFSRGDSGRPCSK